MTTAALSFERPDEGTLLIRIGGPWLLKGSLPTLSEVRAEVERQPPRAVAFAAADLAAWDSGLLTFLITVSDLCQQKKIAIERRGLPAGVQRLLALAEAVPERAGAKQTAESRPWLARVGLATLGLADPVSEMLGFIGDVTISVGKFAARRARFRMTDLWLLIQQAGADALPIITLVSFLVGAILAFVGAVQLQQFGAAIYVANLVGIAMVREMGAMMTAIVIAGRTGAAYAAQLGTMKVTQEIDALTTMGISPMEFLVLPRMIALCLMMPLLCLYADCIGILGGAAVGVGMLKLPFLVYYNQTAGAVNLGDMVGGVFKASVYGILVAVAGCLRGMQCGDSSSAVGEAATRAVVTSIVWIISACGIFAVAFYVMGI